MRLIDGDALTEAFYQKMKELLESTITPQISNEALSLLCGATLITEAPTIEPLVRKTGKWTKKEYAEEVNGYLIPNYECSQCGYWSREDYDYCPDCGSKMER